MVTFEVVVTLDDVSVRWKTVPGAQATADMVGEEIGVAAARALGYSTPPSSSFGGPVNSMTWKKPARDGSGKALAPRAKA